ncbi:MAG: FAD:protein FMN transferase [Pirellulaceae bacterium]
MDMFEEGKAPEALEPTVVRHQWTFSRHAMACPFEVLMNAGQYVGGPEAALSALELVGELEAKWSVFQEESELSRWNRLPEKHAMELTADTARLIEAGLDLAEKTGGAFDFTTGHLTKAWGFYRREGRFPNQEQIESAIQATGCQHLSWDSEKRKLSKQVALLEINPGAIGKGMALDLAAERFRRQGMVDVFLHAGQSSALAMGQRQDGTGRKGWAVLLRHPYRKNEVLGEFHLQDQALGTSGAAQQFFYFQGKRYGHILDPRTGMPAMHWQSVTVVAPTATQADGIATACFVMDPEELQRFALANPQFGIVAVGHDSSRGPSPIETYNLASDVWYPAR